MFESENARMSTNVNSWMRGSVLNQLDNFFPPRDSEQDFRGKATLGVAIASLSLLLPFFFVSAFDGRYLMAAGTLGIVFVLTVNAILVKSNLCHQRLTVWILVPAGMAFMLHVFLKNPVVGSLWCYPSILACYCMLSQRRAFVANACILMFSMPMVWMGLNSLMAARLTATMLAVSLFSGILVSVIDRQQRRLTFQLEHDPLTGLYNRQSLRKQMEKAIESRTQEGLKMTVLMLDLDHFKLINDRFGHDVGDSVLRDTSRILREHMRADDAVFRMGGEEFLILLWNASSANARVRAEQIRLAVERSGMLQHHPITISIGLAELGSEDDWLSWIKRSDDQLYQAKRGGRNRVALRCGSEEAIAAA